MPILAHPHADLELGVPRRSLAYSVALPSAGIGPETGLIVYLFGYGGRFDDPYADKLRPFFADRYDCAVVTVDYHGALAQTASIAEPAPDFFLKLKERHGVEVTAPVGSDISTVAKTVLTMMGERGIADLSEDCRFIKADNGYVNFGVLPALDHLQVIARLLREYPLNRRRIMALGTSYGGYLALMMAKLAPNTFGLVIDNSGFSGPGDDWGTIFGQQHGTCGGIRYRLLAPDSFRRDPADPRYFTPSHFAIRELAEPGHAGPSKTVFHTYHSCHDKVAPTEAKVAAVRVLARHRRHDLRLVAEQDLDGRIFKRPDHGMDASMRGLFQLSYERWRKDAPENGQDITDFDLGTVTALPCRGCVYAVAFKNDGVRLTIT